MRVGVISDTHGILDAAEKAIEQMGDLDLLIHLGDHYEDSLSLKEQFKLEVAAVKGNCDRDADAWEEIILPLESHKLLLVHGHQYGVKMDLSRLYYRALEMDCNIALFGHSHMAVKIEHEGILLMNPGSLSLPRGGNRASYGILTLEAEKLHSEIILLEK